MKARLRIALKCLHITQHIFFCTNLINLLCPEYSGSSLDSGWFGYKLQDFQHLHSRNPMRLHQIASSSPAQEVGRQMDLLNRPAMYQQFYNSIFTACKRSLGQGNIFSSLCQEFCTQRGGGSASVHAGIAPRGKTPSPPGSRHLPAQCMLGDRVNKRAVHILLECILVHIQNSRIDWRLSGATFSTHDNMLNLFRIFGHSRMRGNDLPDMCLFRHFPHLPRRS